MRSFGYEVEIFRILCNDQLQNSMVEPEIISETLNPLSKSLEYLEKFGRHTSIFSEEIILHDTSVGQRKKSESPTGIEPMASQIPVGRSNQLSYVRLVMIEKLSGHHVQPHLGFCQT